MERERVFQLKSPIISDGGVEEWETASERSCGAVIKENKPTEKKLNDEPSLKSTEEK